MSDIHMDYNVNIAVGSYTMQEICLENFSPSRLTMDRSCSKWTMGDFNHVFLKVPAILIILS